MGRIEWHNGLNLGIKEIDDQHKELISIINNVFEAFDRNETDSAIDEVLQRLHEYTVYHFNAEEKYMEKVGYPHLSEHRQQHAVLKNKVKSFRAARFHKEDVFTHEIKELLTRWLLDHILRVDYKIVDFVKKGGAKNWSENIKE
ncbi:bacteriohemerythrin [Maridesulfovibrio sp.]|uniref:bacteriohemerythrin n=1 Tax=Maridesulfovibrio sp. TaxID=2795000 RepID=UPI002AA5F01F|nr:bacteriohemerythrin [Maridesulfovibrio sp.]